MPFNRELTRASTPGQIRESLLEAAYYLADLRARPHAERDETYTEDAKSAVEFVTDWDPVLRAMELGQPTHEIGGPRGATHPNNPEMRSFGELVGGNERYQQFAARGGAGASGFMEIEVPGSLFANNIELRTLINSATSSTGDGGTWLPQAPTPIPPRVRQMNLFLRDVLYVQTTGLSQVPYIQETNAAALEFSASATAEGVAKPEVEMDWSLQEAVVRKLAAWVPVTSEIIDDAPTLQGYIDNRLAYMLAVREEYEILNGSGSAPHLQGLLLASGLQTQAAVSGDFAGTLGKAIGLVENVDGAADGIAMNPIDYWSMQVARFANRFDGSPYGAGSGAPIQGTPGTEWGLPVVRTRALPSGTAVVGSWRQGATLFDRMQTTIKLGNQHSTFFVENKVAILAEERVALAIHRPDFFVKTTLA